MTRDDIIRMAREAGLPIFDTAAVAHDPAEQAMADIVTKVWHDSAERFAALVAAHTLSNIDPSKLMSYQEGFAAGAAAEREACAKVCDEFAERDRLSNYYAVAARAIRARGETE